MKKRFLTLVLFAALMCSAPAVIAEPEELKMDSIRQEMLKPEGPVFEFLQKASTDMGEKLQADIGDGRIDPNDQEAVKKAMAAVAKDIFSQAAELRKTLKEPEHRMAIDMEMVTLGSQAGMLGEVMGLINNWKGDVREAMIITAAQRFQMMKVPFTAEFDELLKELKNSSDSKVVELADRMLNEFFRNPVGKVFPDFPAGKKTIDGKDLSLASLKGKVVLVDFWATWCPPCRAEVGPLVKVYNQYKDKGFEIVGISFDNDRKAFDEYVKENGMPWIHYFDGKGWENEVGPAYGIQSIPTMYLLDKEGKVVSTELRDGKLEEELKKLLK